MDNISLIKILTMNSPLYNKYILKKIYIKKPSMTSWSQWHTPVINPVYTQEAEGGGSLDSRSVTGRSYLKRKDVSGGTEPNALGK
jgi:hypothetical protein